MLKKLKLYTITKDKIKQINPKEPKIKLPIHEQCIDIPPSPHTLEKELLEKRKILIINLRATTGCSIMAAKKALEECEWDFDNAIDYIKQEGGKRWEHL